MLKFCAKFYFSAACHPSAEALRAELSVLNEAGVVSQAKLCEFDARQDLPIDAFFYKCQLGL